MLMQLNFFKTQTPFVYSAMPFLWKQSKTQSLSRYFSRMSLQHHDQDARPGTSSSRTCSRST